MIPKTPVRWFAAVLLSSLAAIANAGDIVVITHPSTGIDSLTRDEVMRIFLAKSRAFPNEKAAVPIAQPEQSNIRKIFEAQVFAKSPTQIKAYWTRLLFTGRGNPPQVLPDDKSVLEKVASTPGAIGYVDKTSINGSVVTVYTIKAGK